MFGLISAGIGLIAGNKKNKQAKKANDQAMDLQREQLAFERRRYDEVNAQYKPYEERLFALASQQQNPDYAGVTSRAMADVNSQFKNSEAARLRSMQRTGVNPNSGRADSLGRNLSLNRALALSGTINNATQKEKWRADDTNWSRLSSVASMGANKMNGVTNNLANAQNNLSNNYSNQSNINSQQASGLFGAAGQAAGDWYAQDVNKERVREWGNKAGGWLTGLGR